MRTTFGPSKPSRSWLLRTGLCAAWLALAAPAGAQQAGYPERPVRIVSISSAGTGVDDFTRLAAKYFSDKTGKSFYVENKPGANSIIATETVAKAAPDGYTLLLAAASALTANPYMYKNLPYDANKDLVPVARMSLVPIVVTVSAKSPFRSLAELQAAGRAAPGKLSYGTATSGYKVMTVAINNSGKMQAQDVAYKGSSLMLPDLMNGTLDYALVEISQVVPQVQAGRLRALAVSSPERVAALPDVPTLAESGAGDATMISWLGLFAPAGTPAAIVDKVARLAVEFAGSPEAKEHFLHRGTAAYPAAGAAFKQAILQDQALWKRYITEAGIEPQ